MTVAKVGGGPARAGVTRPASPLGRKRDHTRDPEILRAALAVLAEAGYEGLTIDMVAARAGAGKATVYRRWATKEELILSALGCLKDTAPGSGGLPDTGTLHDDLHAMISPDWLGGGEQRVKIMAGLASMLSHAPELARAVTTALVEPASAACRELMERAARRGEIPAAADISTLAEVIPSMAAYRVIFMHQVADRAFFEAMIDHVVLPALGLSQT
jgi:AcrR family transcriptional regulator